jgi:hypothetical protein
VLWYSSRDSLGPPQSIEDERHRKTDQRGSHSKDGEGGKERLCVVLFVE